MAMALRLPEQNQVFLVGRLTRDPDVRFTQKGQSVAKFDIAVNRRYKDNTSGEWKDDTVFVPVVVWGPAAERCKDRLKKGSPVHVEGRLSLNEWTDKTGQKRKTMEVISRRLQFLAAAETQQSGGQEAAPETSAPVEDAASVDDVPF